MVKKSKEPDFSQLRGASRQQGYANAPQQGYARASQQAQGQGQPAYAYRASAGGAQAASQELIRVKKKRKKTSRAKKVIIGVLIALVLVIAATAVALGLYVSSVNKAISFEEQEQLDRLQEALVAQEEDEPFYMLLLGSDAREGDTASRSDVIILTRVDAATGTVTMVSVPRDTMVELEGHGRQKINAAYAFDGAAGAVKAVSDFAGVPISHYAEIHFDELESLVDQLGGVWVDVPVTNDQTGSSNTGVTLNAGEQLLNGEQALAFARERYGYLRGDFQRTDNQRILAEAIMKQVLELPALELPGTIQSLAQCVSTDLSVTDIVQLALKFQESGLTVYSGMAPSSTATIDGVSYVITDYVAWAEMMELVDAGLDPNGAVEAQSETPASEEAAAADADDGGEVLPAAA